MMTCSLTKKRKVSVMMYVVKRKVSSPLAKVVRFENSRRGISKPSYPNGWQKNKFVMMMDDG
jgi:hypothetical protein